MAKQTFQTDFAGQKLIIETGELAQQAGGSCTVRFGDTVVLAAATMGGIREGIDFFPLSVDYEEKLYAAGKIKGSRWIKREGRPSDEAILTARLVDRAIRPLFPKEIKNEVQVILTVLSFDAVNDSDVLGLIAASAALALSPIPWNGPLAGLRVGRVNDEWLLNPSFEARDKSDLDLVIAGKDSKVLMIEAEGREVPEDVVYGAVDFSVKHLNKLSAFISEVAAAAGKPKTAITALTAQATDETPEAQRELLDKAQRWIEANVPTVLFDKTLKTKTERYQAVAGAKLALLAHLEQEGIGKDRRKKALPLIDQFIEQTVTKAILDSDKRVDGRKLTDIRPLATSVSVLPRTHGSGIFNRGETQVLSVVTLGAPGDEQFLEGLEESGRKRYMHHYNFPPYSVGEAGRLGSPGRREIGHGALAEKALKPVLPKKEDFPYTIRVVSEVLSSNGSSSMGATCGSTLALMDAGVPISKPVAGIAMGVASDEAKGAYKVLTDLQDLEDGAGGMDFKIAGTAEGITAIQLDTKTLGLPLQVIKQALEQGHGARLQVLSVMAQAITAPRADLSKYAPRIISFTINPDRIRDVIGPGGKIINEIIDKTGVQIDIEPDGLVMVTATDAAGGQKAVEWIKMLVREVQIGEIFDGKVTRIMDFGAIVEILPNQDGMVHISEIAHHRVEAVSDLLKVGDPVKVKVIAKENGKTSLSIKALLPRPEGSPRFGGEAGSGPAPHRGAPGRDRGGQGRGFFKPRR
ncbi:MAG: polyribonucleotide nucleotidyltransferase [Candidatus Buchananbacteria bacterium RIFCSPLOWO2_01_FULL_56_15]|uniref:Polyribonucleotide nucleotidyltransferase n=2 Tax=Candidatus Buchananiibacteriota TaxID=1817903 RepID=A0A1G1YJ27_9BACT|nr:MAG: polyribonucleotide nucleotidyltransferase [Candidatus Buchananbacteria bacterium RIFCSPHIGHO2_02_FULL_56_16]OGY55256.1 MAG: polyribonucleotide nucleotidyltransferase [Candidatus Buchananbacteria bacterium RIFCSPLOWO2_01_FULL_56_15]